MKKNPADKDRSDAQASTVCTHPSPIIDGSPEPPAADAE